MENTTLTQEEYNILFKNEEGEVWYEPKQKEETIKDMVERVEAYDHFYRQERNDIYINRFYQDRFK
jgi:hypothetical protein